MSIKIFYFNGFIHFFLTIIIDFFREQKKPKLLDKFGFFIITHHLGVYIPNYIRLMRCTLCSDQSRHEDHTC